MHLTIPLLSQESTQIAQIVLPVALHVNYSYLIPPLMDVSLGDWVEVRLQNKKMIGIVADIKPLEETTLKLKPIVTKLDIPPVPQISLEFIKWVADYTVSPLGMVLKMLSAGADLEKPFELKDNTADHFVYEGATLSEEQAEAAQFLKEQVEAQKYTCSLLDGVTGSGKTEVYFEAIAKVLAQGKQVLVLLPEISLTPQWLSRFEKRFGITPTLWHSDLTPKTRRVAWRRILSGDAKIIVGARSALFLPYLHLGFIIVDEEHESAYKQEEGVIYHGRDMAVVRAYLGEIPIVLVSATPSLETYQNVQNGRYHHIELKNRHLQADFAALHLIDLKKDPPAAQRFLSPKLVQAIEATLIRSEQAMLFLNRRGYAPLTLCRHCGYRFKCPDCASWLIHHKMGNRLRCHHCDYQIALPEKCPECAEMGCFAACGPGVERVADEITLLFPEARVGLMTSDHIQSPKAMSAFIHQVETGEIDILIGTQMMAKGHHFPKLTLIGVVDADLGLQGGDLRACERTYQLLHQVSGRAGRTGLKAEVYIQSYQPEHEMIQALQRADRDGFLSLENQARFDARMPPYGKLAAIILSDTDETRLAQFCQRLAHIIPTHTDFSVWGPVVPPLALLRGKHRRRFLVQGTKNAPIQAYVKDWLSRIKQPSTIKVTIDIDPYSFF